MKNAKQAKPESVNDVANVELTYSKIQTELIYDNSINGKRVADDDLVKSIQENGILTGILLREIPKDDKRAKKDTTCYEVICGTRRLDAARKAGLKEVPAFVVDNSVNDSRAMELNLVENLQRQAQDPFQEASLFAILVKQGFTEREIGKRIGKSERFVKRRLQLTKLDKTVAKQLDWNHAKVECVELLASLPKSKQADLVSNQPYMVGSLDELRRHIENSDQLGAGDFDPADESLVAKVGACSECNKRTGAEPLLFEGEVDTKADHCLDSTCYLTKLDVALGRGIAKIREKNPSAMCIIDGYVSSGIRKVYEGHGAKSWWNIKYTQCAKSDKGAVAAILLKEHKAPKVTYVRTNATSSRDTSDGRKIRPQTTEERYLHLEKRRLAHVGEEIKKLINEGHPVLLPDWERAAKLLARYTSTPAENDSIMTYTLEEMISVVTHNTKLNRAHAIAAYSVTDIKPGPYKESLFYALSLMYENAQEILDGLIAQAVEEIPVPKSWPKLEEK